MRVPRRGLAAGPTTSAARHTGRYFSTARPCAPVPARNSAWPRERGHPGRVAGGRLNVADGARPVEGRRGRFTPTGAEAPTTNGYRRGHPGRVDGSALPTAQGQSKDARGRFTSTGAKAPTTNQRPRFVVGASAPGRPRDQKNGPESPPARPFTGPDGASRRPACAALTASDTAPRGWAAGSCPSIPCCPGGRGSRSSGSAGG